SSNFSPSLSLFSYHGGRMRSSQLLCLHGRRRRRCQRQARLALARRESSRRGATSSSLGSETLLRRLVELIRRRVERRRLVPGCHMRRRQSAKVVGETRVEQQLRRLVHVHDTAAVVEQLQIVCTHSTTSTEQQSTALTSRPHIIVHGCGGRRR